MTTPRSRGLRARRPQGPISQWAGRVSGRHGVRRPPSPVPRRSAGAGGAACRPSRALCGRCSCRRGIAYPGKDWAQASRRIDAHGSSCRQTHAAPSRRFELRVQASPFGAGGRNHPVRSGAAHCPGSSRDRAPGELDPQRSAHSCHPNRVIRPRQPYSLFRL